MVKIDHQKRDINIKMAAWQQLCSPQVTIALGSLGFDWIILDLEHTSITSQEAEAIFIAAERLGVEPWVRLPCADPFFARRLLDAGAIGLIVPVVEDRVILDEFAQHCFFPPKGRRGLGLTRSNLWGDKLNSYYHEFKPKIIAQIESRVGAKNIEAILESSYLDGIMIGPYDLSASLLKPGQFDDAEYQSTCSTILKAARKYKKWVGYHQVQPDQNELNKRISEHYDFIAYGTDIVAMRYALKGI